MGETPRAAVSRIRLGGGVALRRRLSGEPPQALDVRWGQTFGSRPAVRTSQVSSPGTELEQGATPASYRSSEVRSGAESERAAPDSVGAGDQAH